MSWISDKYNSFPFCKTDDNFMDLIYSKANWFKTLKMNLNFETGTWYDKENECVKDGFDTFHKKVKAFRLKPTGTN